MFYQCEKILRRKMSRKEFLVFLGMFTFSLLGISGLLRRFNVWQQSNLGSSKPYSGGKYGL